MKSKAVVVTSNYLGRRAGYKPTCGLESSVSIFPPFIDATVESVGLSWSFDTGLARVIINRRKNTNTRSSFLYPRDLGKYCMLYSATNMYYSFAIAFTSTLFKVVRFQNYDEDSPKVCRAPPMPTWSGLSLDDWKRSIDEDPQEIVFAINHMSAVGIRKYTLGEASSGLTIRYHSSSALLPDLNHPGSSPGCWNIWRPDAHVLVESSIRISLTHARPAESQLDFRPQRWYG